MVYLKHYLVMSYHGEITVTPYDSLAEAQNAMKDDFENVTGYPFDRAGTDDELDATAGEYDASYHSDDLYDYGWSIFGVNEKGEII